MWRLEAGVSEPPVAITLTKSAPSCTSWRVALITSSFESARFPSQLQCPPVVVIGRAGRQDARPRQQAVADGISEHHGVRAGAAAIVDGGQAGREAGLGVGGAPREQPRVVSLGQRVKRVCRARRASGARGHPRCPGTMEQSGSSTISASDGAVTASRGPTAWMMPSASSTAAPPWIAGAPVAVHQRLGSNQRGRHGPPPGGSRLEGTGYRVAG